MTATDHLKPISKFLSLVLRHQPEAIGITLDREGWVSLDVLIAGAKAHDKSLDVETIREVVATSDKQRFALSPDGLSIRANQGHSTASVALTFEAVTPPDHLYHGTVARFLDAIRGEGLKPGSRHHVHLSPDRETAAKVGARRGEPLILVIDSGRMHRDGHAFFRSDNGVWLTAHVPPAYLAAA